MSVRRLDPVQPSSFAFTSPNLEWAREIISHYPEGKQASAVIALLWRAQEQHDGWLPEPAIRYIGEMLDMAHIRVLEVATFYTMFQLSPVGTKAHIQVCGTTPCMLRGAQDLIDLCKRRINAEPHKLSDNGDFTWEEMECLGACVNAPLIQVGADLFEDLTPDSLEAVLDAFARGEKPASGPRIERQFSAPSGGLTSLNTPGLYEDLARASAGPGAAAGGMENGASTGPGAGSARSSARVEASSGGLTAPVNVTVAAVADNAKPDGLGAPRGGNADDLKLINGVGPKLEGTLNGLGVYHFDQVAAWSPATVTWVDDYLSFKGRIDRDGWIEQAKALVAGGGAMSGAVAAGGVATATALAAGLFGGAGGVPESQKPELLSAPRGGKGDDLSLILGVGDKLESELHKMGVWHFDQIAAWTPDNIEWFEAQFTGIDGLVARSKWIKQAKKLTGGWRPDSDVGEKV